MGGKVEAPMEFKIQVSYDDGKTWMDLRRYYLPNCSFEATKKTIDLYRKESTRIKYRSITKKAHDAISAPQRNCDLFDTKDKAREAFQKLRGHIIRADVSLWDDRNEIEAFFNWLFAEAKGEKK